MSSPIPPLQVLFPRQHETYVVFQSPIYLYTQIHENWFSCLRVKFHKQIYFRIYDISSNYVEFLDPRKFAMRWSNNEVTADEVF